MKTIFKNQKVSSLLTALIIFSLSTFFSCLIDVSVEDDTTKKPIVESKVVEAEPAPQPVPVPMPTPAPKPVPAVEKPAEPVKPVEEPVKPVIADQDQDSIADETDNCVKIANVDQSDIDKDGVGDICDNCKEVANSKQEDSNSDAIGDLCTKVEVKPEPAKEEPVKEKAFVTYFEDLDNDGYGNPFSKMITSTKPAGYILDNTDCNDDSASINPGAVEQCNYEDDNCNGEYDEGLEFVAYYYDSDNDGFGGDSFSLELCTQEEGFVTNNTDCDDNDTSINENCVDNIDGADAEPSPLTVKIDLSNDDEAALDGIFITEFSFAVIYLDENYTIDSASLELSNYNTDTYETLTNPEYDTTTSTYKFIYESADDFVLDGDSCGMFTFEINLINVSTGNIEPYTVSSGMIAKENCSL